MKKRIFNRLNFVALAAIALLTIGGPPAQASDVEVTLTTNNGASKFVVQDSDAVEVSSVDSNGNAYFNTVTQTGAGGNVILNQEPLQSGAEFNVSSGTFDTQMQVGNVVTSGAAGTSTDNYLAITLPAGAAIAAKQVVVLNTAGNVATVTTASSNTVVGITVSATSAGGQNIRVAVSGVVSGVTCNTAIAAGTRVCTSVSAGRVGACASATNDAVGVGKMVTACTAAGQGSLLLWSH